ncbi:helix-turn-helix transcriptional regulator [Catellatospora citrea]|uniref:helix-turn-helix transcriptional regulator n=1 Tax=Catellatospora citrea TaxID=53366 RepID=UPI00340B6092
MTGESRYRPPPAAGIEHKLTPGEELHTFMLFWRLRLDPRKIPALNLPGVPRRARVSQGQVAMLAGVSVGWYSKLERGEPANHQPAVLGRVADALELDRIERQFLLDLVQKARPLRRYPAARPVGPAIQQMLEQMPWPAWVSGPWWDIVALNATAYEWFPHMHRELNVMRWVWCDPSSREQLIGWHEVWSPRMLAQLRAAKARYSDCIQLHELITEILETNPDALQDWDEKPSLRVHPDGDVRQLWVPGRPEPMTVELVALTPMRDEDMRLVCLVPTVKRPPDLGGQVLRRGR